MQTGKQDLVQLPEKRMTAVEMTTAPRLLGLV
jgi:hypothetical protein